MMTYVCKSTFSNMLQRKKYNFIANSQCIEIKVCMHIIENHVVLIRIMMKLNSSSLVCVYA